MFIYNLYLLSFILMLYRAPVDTSPVTEGVTLFKHQLLLLVSQFTAGKKDQPVIGRLGSVRIGQTCDLGQHFQDLGHDFPLYGPPSQPLTYIYYMAR